MADPVKADRPAPTAGADPGKRPYDAPRRAAAAARTRARIREAAARLFVEQGYAATRMREIARAAGVGSAPCTTPSRPRPRCSATPSASPPSATRSPSPSRTAPSSANSGPRPTPPRPSRHWSPGPPTCSTGPAT
ncbi:helix-turn-helix domain-containing protein [Streptomyces sp. SBR177]